VGTPAVELLLASPATGPVDTVWFGPDGRLFARTHSGRTFETSDFEIWTPSANTTTPQPPMRPQVSRKPEPESQIVADVGRMYALGRNLFRSDDSGLTWNNLTGYKSQSVIGSGQHSVAVGPNDQLVVANDYGVWRSMDGGLSWAGLNQRLPNLPVRRILSAPQGTRGMRIAVEGVGAIELQPGTGVWTPVRDNSLALEAQVLVSLSGAVGGGTIKSFAASGGYTYAGTADGRVWVWPANADQPRLSNTGGATGSVERIFVDPNHPLVALAAVGSHVLHTINGGIFWDRLDGNLPSGAAVHGIAADEQSGAIYVATDQGVFWARTDIELATPPPTWISLNAGLQAAPATDVMLDSAGIRLYVAIDGYGVYSTAAPHRSRALRVVNAADLSTRPAAPGGLLSVIGGRVNSATDGALNYPVLAAADDGSQIQVPFEATGPNVTLALMTPGGRVQIGMPVQPVAPAIFVNDGVPMLQDADSGLLLDSRNAAKSGARVQVFATGLGRVNPEWPAGLQAPLEGAPSVVAPVRAFLNGSPIQVTRATLAPGYVGFYVVEVQLPTLNNGGVNELYITANGVESNRVAITIEQ
jgi:uncharacterized protein (TIGR03437 family)